MFIIDRNHHLIAAEQTDLKRWGFATVYEAAQAFAEGEIRLDPESGTMDLKSGHTLNHQITPLESTLGLWYLCVAELREEATEGSREVQEEGKAEELLPLETEEAEQAAPALSEIENEAVDEELEALLKLLPEEESPSEKAGESALPGVEEEEPLSLREEEEPLDLLEEAPAETETPPAEEETELPAEEEEPLLQLLEEETPPLELEEAAEERPVSEAEIPEWEELEKTFRPDLEANAARLDLGSSEYKALLEDLRHDTAQMHEQLLSDDPRQRHEAVSILKDAVTLLQLSPLDRLLSMLENAGPGDRRAIVDTLERALASLTIEETPPVEAGEALGTSAQEAVPETAPRLEAPVERVEETEAPAAAPAKEVPVDEFLKGVEPIPISFSLHVAAEELSLPEDLVREFVTDFANQGHEYLPVLIQAYEEKDLDKLQKTAHMLKGAASNLRVEAMVENLYELQFDNNIERAPERIRKFAGQLMSLDNFLKQLNG